MNSVNQSIMPVTAAVNQNNHLEIGGCDCIELAKQYGTPLYVLDEETLRQSCRQYKQAFSSYENTLCLFASKAFMTQAICCILQEEGFGLDVVSGGEIYTALKAGFPMDRIYFNGNNKSEEELELAVSSGLSRITVDSFHELEQLDKTAGEKGKKVQILLRITPGIECHTHEYIKTGQTDSKFGFDLLELDKALSMITREYKNLDLRGLHAHIGSQIFDISVYYDLVRIMIQEMSELRDRFGVVLEEMNIGGGLGIRYVDNDDPPSMEHVAKLVIDSINVHSEKFNYPKPRLVLEPGRSIVGTSGVTLYTVGTHKQVPNATKYIAVDGGMADNPRPAMYQALYHAVAANKVNENSRKTVTIAGRYCESGDIIIKDIEMPDLEAGDVICVFNTGAYNYSMASNYNRVPRPAAVIVNDGQSDIFIKRETYEDLVSFDVIPERLKCRNTLV
jgi:diaminopimelate decarboxylase